MARRVEGIWRLTRFPEYVAFVIVTTLLGAAAAGGSFGAPLVIVLAANWLAVGFAFMINDVEDAPDDAMSPAKAVRNPVASGALTPRFARALSLLTAGLAAILYAFLGAGPFLAGLACLTLAFLYSFRPIRLKATPVADLVSHALMLAGLQFLAAYLAFGGGLLWRWVFPLMFVLAVSLYGQLFNELRDFDGDLQAGVTHTASLLGRRTAQYLMMAWVCVGIVSGLYTILIIRLIPVWALIAIFLLALLLSLRRLPGALRARSAVELQQPFQKPIEVAAALVLTVWFTGPPALSLLGTRFPWALPWQGG